MNERDHDGDSGPRRLGVRAFRNNISDVLRQVRGGCSFLITSRDEVLAELHPPSVPMPPRREPGALRGQIRMAPDFDALPPDVLAAMEGRED